ncbi:MAG TPA: NAD(P)H-dependent oxidoreductase subunit E [Nitrospirae bacterium]|nr:NADP-reducing hydrogenase subunit HndA [bacterium BMS3Abin06]HDH11611.1 NAD(P)H-dependent oxidoreductase subunit E [Nitrospirota bacterium]HDZ02031.1 NAD(P)H-dependent oxidoreductase subunit E [Nitrospirota bacterium]
MNEKKCEAILNKYNEEKGSIISILQDIQEGFGYIPEDVVFWFAEKLNIPASNFFGVTTFYAQFYLKPRGKHIITACCGTACHVKGAEPIINRMRADLGIAEGEDTTADGWFTLEKLACIGACSIAPVLIVNKKVYGGMSPDKASRMLKEYEKSSPR